MTKALSLRQRGQQTDPRAGRPESPAATDLDSDVSVLEQLVEQQTLELEQAQSRLRLSERMAALGNLSAGLAHDMGNLLLPIKVRLDALESRGLGPEAQQDVNAVKDAVQHLQRLANGLRLFSLDPNQGARADVTDLHEWWPDVEPFFRHALGRGARIEVQFKPDLPPVQIARHRLTQAVYYLVQNARDAALPDTELRVTVSAEVADDWIVLQIADNGRGMSQEVQGRCLEPYFTTKPRSMSTGLGLSLVHGILEKVGGTISVSSTEGQGTTLALRLKRAETGESRRVAAGNALVTVSDARVRSYLSGLLRAHGYAFQSADRLPIEDETLWVSDLSPGMEPVLDFVRSPGRWAIVLSNDEQPELQADRVFIIPASPKPSLFRESLERIAEERATGEEQA